VLHVATPNMVAKQVTGFFTRERWILGRTPIEMEGLLGFGPGRMANGAAVYALLFLPLNHEFELAGYTHWARGQTARGEKPGQWPKAHVDIDKRVMPSPIDRAKESVRRTWTLVGPERLVRVEPSISHVHGVSLYPPGIGVEQWNLLEPIMATLVKQLQASEPYAP